MNQSLEHTTELSVFRKIDRDIMRQYRKHHETSAEDIWDVEESLATYELENSENLLSDFACNYLPIAFGSTREDRYASFNMAMPLDTYMALRYQVKSLVMERKGLTCAQVQALTNPLTGDNLPLLQEFLVKFRDGFIPAFNTAN